MATHLRLDDPMHGRWIAPALAILGLAIFALMLIGLFRAAL